jgi:DNA topoisomerase-3
MKYKYVIIAEKPSVGKAIADVMPGQSERTRTHIICGDVAITWAFGHIYELIGADEYNPAFKDWNFAALPIVPNPFKLKESASAAAQCKAIAALVKNTSVVIHAGDPDREGQLIVDEILTELKFTGQVKRMMLNATDTQSVKTAMASLKDNKDYQKLYEAALCRSQADWLVGINLTRGVSTGMKGDWKGFIRIGRVSTPTMAMLVTRDLLIDNFVPKTFYRLEAQVKTESGKSFVLNCDPRDDLRIWDKEVAQDVANKLKGKTVNLSVVSKQSSEAPYKLFNVLTFSKAMFVIAKTPPKKAADMLQQLYEAKLTTYPRTGHEKLPAEHKPMAMPIAKHLVANSDIDEFATMMNLMAPRPSNYDLPKEIEHHAIVPTIKPASNSIPPGCEQAYFVIARRFLISLLPDYKYMATTIGFNADPYTFSIKGEVGLNVEQSWRAFEKKKEAVVLPSVKDGERALIESVKIVEGATTPPDRYTAISLMEDMSNIAKYETNPKLKAILKDNSGIGTDATRSDIVAKLVNDGFAVEGGKGSLISTDYAKEVFHKIPAQLKSAGITAVWEDALSMIAKGEYQPSVFMEKIVAYVQKILGDISSSKEKINLSPPRAPTQQGSKASSAHSSRTSRKKKASSSAKGTPNLAG